MNTRTRSIRALERPATGEYRVPASKSVLNRMLVCGSLTAGTSVLHGFQDAGEDVQALIAALGELGVSISQPAGGAQTRTVTSTGPPFEAPHRAIQTGEAGTATRFVTALAALADGPVRLEAGPRMSERPMRPLYQALQELGARVETASDAPLPCRIDGASLQGGAVSIPGDVSSQFASALMMIAPLLRNGVEMTIADIPLSAPYLSLTAEAMACFGVDVEVSEGGCRFFVAPQEYRPAESTAPADASSALFPFVAAVLTGGEISVPNLSLDWTQPDLIALEILQDAGCRIAREGTRITCGGRPLQGIHADFSDCPDAAPALAMVAALAPQPSRLSGLETLRHKECDRIQAVADGLTRLGGSVRATDDAWEIEPAPLAGGTIDSRGDHRMAMAFAMLGLAVDGVRISDPACVAKSWPGFWDFVEEIYRQGP